MALRRILEDGSLEATGGSAPGVTTTGFRAVTDTAPNTSGWAAGDLWLDTSDPDGDGNVIRRWTGATWSPEPAGAPVLGDLLLSDDFTGADGAAWDSAKWALGRNPLQGTGGGATLLAGSGVLAASNYGNFHGDSMASRRLNIADQADVNIEFSFKFDATLSYLFVHARHSTATLDRLDGYALSINRVSDEWSLVELTGYAQSGLGSVQSYSFDADTWHRARFYVVGTAIKAKVWPAEDTEPGSWDVEVTDSTYSAAGKTGFSVAGGATSALARRVFIDDVIVRDS
jgi:hypothetical protein